MKLAAIPYFMEILYRTIKPIFHCDAKYLASGVGVGQCTRRQNCALPNAKYTNMLVSFALCDTNSLRWPCTFHFFCLDFIRVGKPTRTPFPVEYRWRWVHNATFSRWPCTFHVVYPVFFCVGYPLECFSQWNMGLNVQHGPRFDMRHGITLGPTLYSGP